MEDLKDKLKTEVETADWSMLEPHYDRGTIVQVSPKLDLLDVGVAVAQDKLQIVKLWLDDKLLIKSDDIETITFKEDPYKKQFKFLIIQPYVLIQVCGEELS